MDGNITDTPNIFPTIAHNMGIDPTILFLMMGVFVMIPLAYWKAPKMFYPLGFLIYTFFGMNFGILPIWALLIAFVFFGISTAGEISKFLGGSESKYIQSHYTLEIQPEPKTENCKNCGGPNVDRVTCEWCGQVLE